MMKRIWKLVHPDLFSASLKQSLARSVNEESMKSLNQWVEAGGQARLTFYVHDRGAAPRDKSALLRKVDVVMAGNQRVALRKLLEALMGGQKQEQVEEEEEEEEESFDLMSWLTRNAPVARDKMARFQGLDREEALYRHILARDRVGISFSSSFRPDKVEKVRLVSLVASMAERCPTLKGVRVQLVDGSTDLRSVVDGMGRLVLRATDGLDAWCDSFTEESRRLLQVIQGENDERRYLESSAALALKVRLVTGEGEAMLRSADYLSLLRELTRCERPGTAFPQLSLLFWRDADTALSPKRDTMYSSMSDATSIIREIDKLPIAEIQRELRVFSALEEQESQTRVFTKRRLRLAGLLRSPTMSMEQSRSCQQRLSVAGNGIVNHAHGLYIRIDSCFSLDDDGTLGVSWNCRV